MKRLRVSLLVLVTLLGSQVPLYAQNADEIVKKHMDAIGGVPAWKAIKAMKMSGSITVEDMEIPMDLTIVQKKAMRMDMELMGIANYTILTKTAGWAYFPIKGDTDVTAFTPEEVKMGQDQLNIQGDLSDYKAEGSKVEYMGEDTTEGIKTLKLRFVTSDNVEKTMYFDASTYYLVKQVQQVQDEEGNAEEIATVFSGFQKLPEGITIPMAVTSPVGLVTIKTIKINPEVDDRIFKPGN